MARFVLAGIIIVALCTLILIHNSFTSLPTKNGGTPQHISQQLPNSGEQQVTHSLQANGAAKAKINSGQEKDFLQHQQQLPPMEKGVVQDIKTTHGEAIIKKPKTGQNITVLSTEDKRITGLQMPKDETPATETATYFDDKNSTNSFGIETKGTQPAYTETYNPDQPEPRY